MDTNFTTDQILSMYNIGRDILRSSRNEGASMVIDRMQLEVYNLRVFLPRARSHTSALGYYPGSLAEAVHGMRVNLGLEQHELIKTFSFSVNEEYEQRPLGRGIRTGGRLELMPNLVGRSRAFIEDWANTRGISLTFENVSAGHQLYNASLPQGAVVGQSIHQNELVIIQTRLVIYVINRSSTPPLEEPDEPDEPDDPIEEP
jgi:hypothetical protein